MEQNQKQIEKTLQEMNLEENQGGDLQPMDYVIYAVLGVVFPVALLIWGWF